MNEILNVIPPLTVAIITFAVAGIVELIKRVFDRDWRAVTTILLSGLVGGGIGFGMGTTFIIGAVFGMSATGLITVLQNTGKK